MDLKNAKILITGGSEGIGFGLAARFIKSGSTVMITGRNQAKLQQAKNSLPGLLTSVSDIGNPQQREDLAKHISEVMPDLNILINNAGIQRRISLAEDHAGWSERQAEIDVLFSGPVHLNHLLIPIMLKHEQASLIVNVTSGGAYIPQVFAPVYSASKAALHSYTVTLRHSLSDTAIRVAELIPPAVQTALTGPGLNHGVSLDEFCDTVFEKLIKDDVLNVGFGPTAELNPEFNGKSADLLFQSSASRFPVEVYKIGK